LTEPESVEEKRIRHEKELAHDRANLEKQLVDLKYQKDRDLAKQRAEVDKAIANRTRWLAFLGTLLAALIAAGGTFLLDAFGKKADGNSTRFLSNVYSGIAVTYRLANPKIPAADVLPQRTEAKQQSSPLTAASPVPHQPPPVVMPMPQNHIPTASCAGLDDKSWTISLGSVVPFSSNPKGYTVHLRFRNNTQVPIGLKLQGQAELTDNNGNRLGLTSSSIAIPNFGVGPTSFGAGVDSPVSFVFAGASQLGTLVDFDVSLNSSTTLDGKPNNQQITLGCTSLPVTSPANVATPQ
jgi:hypothetical protein